MGQRRQRQLQNYIAKKLKKEARPELLERLQKAAYAGNGLQSTKNLLVPVPSLCQLLVGNHYCVEQTRWQETR